MTAIAAKGIVCMTPDLGAEGGDQVLHGPNRPDHLIGRIERERGSRECFGALGTQSSDPAAHLPYARGSDAGWHAHGICVLTLAGSRLSRIVSFNDPGLFPAFGFPARLPAEEPELVP